MANVRFLAIPIVCFLAVAGVLTLHTLVSSPSISPTPSATASFSNPVVITVEKTSGTYTYIVHNLVTNNGLNHVRTYLSTNTTGVDNAAKYISLSNDTPANADWLNLPTAYTDYGLARATGTSANGDNGIYTVTYKFTCTADSKAVQCAGLNWGGYAGDNTLFAAATFTATTLNTNDNLTVTWTITMTSG